MAAQARQWATTCCQACGQGIGHGTDGTARPRPFNCCSGGSAGGSGGRQRGLPRGRCKAARSLQQAPAHTTMVSLLCCVRSWMARMKT